MPLLLPVFSVTPNPSSATGRVRSSLKVCLTSDKAIRSCGRFGPAILGSMSLRSTSSTSEYSTSPRRGIPNIPCALRYASTVLTCVSSRPVRRRYRIVSASGGKNPIVAPYSGHIFEIVARSGSESASTPSPKNSTNLPTTAAALRRCVTVNTRSVAVTPSCNSPLRWTPSTSGVRI